MPFVYDRIYPEIENSGFCSRRLNILVCLSGSQDRLREAVRQLAVLRQYLRDLEDSAVHLSIYVAAPTVPDWLRFYTPKVVSYCTESTVIGKELHAMAEAVDADFLLIDSESGEAAPEVTAGIGCPVVGPLEVLRQAEVFVNGHDIPWSFAQPAWNMPWAAFNSMTSDSGQRAYQMFQKRARALISNEFILEVTRSLLLNRLANICYTRDKLHFLRQQRDFAKRHNWTRQRYAFEAGYYLNHYIHLLWGGTEQVARVLESALELQVSNRVRVSLGNPDFVGKLMAKDSRIGQLFTQKWFTDWIGKLKLCRDHIAHQGTVVLSPLAKEPESVPTDEEIDLEARSSSQYASLVRLLPADQLRAQLEMLKENLRVSKFNILRDDVMIIIDSDKKTLLFPLDDIDWHFQNYNMTVEQSLDLLFTWLEKRPS